MGYKVVLKDLYGGVADLLTTADAVKMHGLLEDFLYVTGDDLSDTDAWAATRKLQVYLKAAKIYAKINSMQPARMAYFVDLPSATITPAVLDEVYQRVGLPKTVSRRLDEHIEAEFPEIDEYEELGVPRLRPYDEGHIRKPVPVLRKALLEESPDSEVEHYYAVDYPRRLEGKRGPVKPVSAELAPIHRKPVVGDQEELDFSEALGSIEGRV